MIDDLGAGRVWLEVLAAQAIAERGLLALDGRDPDIEDVRRRWSLARLTGVAA